MRPIALKITAWVRLLTVLIVLFSWVTGIVYFVLKRWFETEGMFGPEPHPKLPTFLRLHGAGSYLMILLFGIFLAGHVPLGWKSKRHLVSGFCLIGSFVVLIISAWILYYAFGDLLEYRERVALVHTFVGVGLPFILLWHILTAIHKRRRKKKQQQLQ